MQQMLLPNGQMAPLNLNRWRQQMPPMMIPSRTLIIIIIIIITMIIVMIIIILIVIIKAFFQFRFGTRRIPSSCFSIRKLSSLSGGDLLLDLSNFG